MITNYLSVKIIRDDDGVPFLYHDHPWNKELSYILAGRYDERILDKKQKMVIEPFQEIDGLLNI